jgi:lipopolysaccharide export LptBFGC system permease protein LptF
MAVRVAAAVAAAVFAFGLPVLIVLLSVADEKWRPLVGTLIVVLVAVSVAAWFLSKQRRPASEPENSTEGPP